MASGLGQRLVDEGKLKAERLEDAYQRQVLYGGQLDTILLEMGLIDEGSLLETLGRRFQLPIADAAALDAVGIDVLRLLPRRLAERYRLIPLSLQRRQLHVACCRPLPLDVADDIGFMLSLFLVPHITSELRIHYALHKHYGVDLPARYANLLAQLGVDVDVDVDEAPSPAEADPPAAEDSASAWVVDEPARSAPLPPPDDAPEPASGEWQSVAASEAGIDAGEIAFAKPAESLSALLTSDDANTSADEPLSVDVPQRLQDRLRQDLQAEQDQKQRRHEKVRWSIDDASAELALSRSRDDIVEVLMRFAYRRLDQVAMLVLMGDHFVGWDAIGPKIEDRIGNLRIHASTSAALRTVKSSGAHTLGPLAADDPLCRALCDEPPRAALLMPLFVRERLLGVLYGDRGDRSVDGQVLSELQMLMPKLRLAFEVVILRRKQAASQQLEDFDLDIEVVAELEPGDEAEAIAAELRQPSAQEIPPPPAEDAARDDAAEEDVAEEHVLSSSEPPLNIDGELLARARHDRDLALRVHSRLLAQEASSRLLDHIAQADKAATNDPSRRATLTQIEATPVASLGALARSFPGTIRVNLFGNYDRRPDAKDLSVVCEALLRLGPKVIAPVLVAELDSLRREHRAVATSLMQDLEIPAARPGLLNRLLDPEPRIALLAAGVCTQQGRQAPAEDAAQRIERALRSSDEDLCFRGIRACRACAAQAGLPALIDIVAKKDRDLAEDAAGALREITKQDFGMSARRWRSWLAQHGSQRRVEWLLAGLEHKNRELRQSSQYELEAISGEFMDYRFDAPRNEREAARERWLQWWQQARDRRSWP